MSLMDPECYPQAVDSEPICAKCIDDDDIEHFITNWGGKPGCSFCEQNDAPTALIHDVANWMRECLHNFFSYAGNDLPWEGKEGGFQAPHWDSYDLLYDQLQLELPRDHDDKLRHLLPHLVSQETWCEYDWLSLEYDESLSHAWQELCQTIQHERRFFFILKKADEESFSHPDDYTPSRLLTEIAAISEDLGLHRTLLKGNRVFRARECSTSGPYTSAADLGPPLAEKTTQANRMNPPGIPMMYVADTEKTAVLETKKKPVSVGIFEIERDAQILDLSDLPTPPGIFSGASRRERQGLIFLHAFGREISKPVDQDDRIHIEYIPSQVVTEFFRDYEFSHGNIDGIRYDSSIDGGGRNVVLFATQSDLREPDGSPVAASNVSGTDVWIRLIEAYTIQDA